MINENDGTPSDYNNDTVAKIRELADPGTKVMAAFGGWGQDMEFTEAAASGSMETIASNMTEFVKNQGL